MTSTSEQLKSAVTTSRAASTGARLARRVFDARSRGKAQRNVEAHIDEAELADLLALAYELGVNGVLP
jgi:hypothetical protein